MLPSAPLKQIEFPRGEISPHLKNKKPLGLEMNEQEYYATEMTAKKKYVLTETHKMLAEYRITYEESVVKK